MTGPDQGADIRVRKQRPVVLDSRLDFRLSKCQLHQNPSSAGGMFADIAKRLLDDSKNGQLQISGQSAGFSMDLACAHDGGHLTDEIIAQGLKSDRQAQIFQNGGTQAVADPTHIAQGLLEETLQFIQPAVGQQGIALQLAPKKFDPLNQADEVLNDAIMEFMG